MLINRAIEAAFKDAQRQAAEAEVPDDLVTQITTALNDEPAQAWDEALAEIVREEIGEQS